MLILQWDGSVWSRVAPPSPGRYVSLFDVSVAATGRWASGLSVCQKHCRAGKSPALILHWDGHSWSQVKSLNSESPNGLFGIAAAGRTAWAVGSPACGMPCTSQPALRTVLLRWNGSDWLRITPSPAGKLTLTGVAPEPGGGAIAVGFACTTGCGSNSEVDRTLILRWNGSRWSVVR
jgi:hypothetical protein